MKNSDGASKIVDEALEVKLTAKDEQDVQKRLDEIREQLDEDPTMCDADRKLLMASLEKSVRWAKRLAKKKYTPKKYRRPEWKYEDE